MADDAAGAVRRTPRTDDVPDTFRCHEPFHRDAEVRVSFTGRYYAGAFMGSHIVDADDHHRCTVPPDAVTLLPDGNVVERAARPLAVNALRRYEAEQGFADHLTADDFMTDAREDVRALAADSLLNDPERGRPVVLLRAEDCACPIGGDCPHGPEPVDALDLAVWLHAEAAWRVAGFDVLTVSLARRNKRLTDERDEAVALCANLQATLLSRLAELTETAGKQRSTEWLRTCATLPIEEWPPAPAYKGPMVPAAEVEAARAEANQYHRYYDDAMKVRLDVEKILDEALGTDEEDGAGYGLAGDVALLAQHEKAAVAEVNNLRADLDLVHAERDALQARIDAALAVLDEPVPETPRGANAMWKVQNHRSVQVQRLRAALQGDQPTEPKATEAERPKMIGEYQCRHGKRPLWCAVCAGETPEPTGEADRA